MRTSLQSLTLPLCFAAGLALLIAFALTAVPADAATPGGVVSEFGTPGSGNGQLNGPSGVTLDQTEQIYVADTGNNRIEKFTGEGVYLSQFGTVGSGNGQFNGPSGVAVSAGEIYVADTRNNRVENFTSEGSYVSQFGTAGSANGQFNGPTGLAVDSAGNVYVADTGNNRVEKFTPAGVYVSEFGTAGSGNGQFNAPTGVAVDPAGNVYVADTGNGRVQKFSPEGNFVSVLDTNGSQAVAVGRATNEHAETLVECVYVLDRPAGSPSQIDVYSKAGTLIYTIEAGNIASSHGVLINSRGETSASDAINDDVVRFTRTEILPGAVTEGAFGALATTVTVTGAVEAQASTADTMYSFEYGPTIAYGQSAPIPAGDLGSAGILNNRRVLSALTGLSPSTTYHYRLVVTNPGAGGSTYGADRTFTTVVLPPAVDTAPPSVAATAATLTGGIQPQGLDTTYQFEYGPTASYGSSVPVADADAGSGTTPQPVTQDITGLTPNTTYHYRLVAASVGGTTYGADQAFTTYAPGATTSSVSPFGTGVAPTPAVSYPDLSGLQPTPAPAASPTVPIHGPKCGRSFVQKRVHGKLRCVRRHRHRPISRTRSRPKRG